MLGLLRATLNCAEHWEMISHGSNAVSVITPYPEKKRERLLSAEELEWLLKTLDAAEVDGYIDVYEAVAIHLLIFTGYHLSKTTTLEWASVNFEKARIVLGRHKTDQHSAKIIPLNQSAFDILKALPCVEDNPYVIVGREPGTHLINLQKPLRRLRKLAKLDDVRLHDLRHSFASFAIGADIPLAVIGGLLDHRNVQTTARYAHLADDPLKQANDIVGRRSVLTARLRELQGLTKHNSKVMV